MAAAGEQAAAGGTDPEQFGVPVEATRLAGGVGAHHGAAGGADPAAGGARAAAHRPGSAPARRRCPMSRRTRRPLAAAAAVALAGLVLGLPAAPSASAARVRAADGTGTTGQVTGNRPVSLTRTLTREHLRDGDDVRVDRRTVTVKVDQTANLRSRQPITVAWSGAHPTGAVVPDQNSPSAAQQEYPVVVLECRGVDSTSVPASQRLRPENCWTQSSRERFQARRHHRVPAVAGRPPRSRGRAAIARRRPAEARARLQRAGLLHDPSAAVRGPRRDHVLPRRGRLHADPARGPQRRPRRSTGQHDVRADAARRHRSHAVHHLDQGRQRVARLLGDGRLLPRRGADHGHLLRHRGGCPACGRPAAGGPARHRRREVLEHGRLRRGPAAVERTVRPRRPR
nr:hypothetical protein [Angustibacter aerolatus]